MEKAQGKPKYYKLMETLRNDIYSGRIKAGDKLPSENELSAKYGISRHTVRKAISLLENDGLIIAEHGRGTYVSDKRSNSIPSNNIAVVTTYISDYIFPRVIQGIDKVLTANGYSIMIKNTGNSQANEAVCLEDVLNKNIDGLIIEPSKSEVYCNNLKQYEALDNLGIPYVFIQGRYIEMKDKPSILMDDVKGAYLLTKYLIDIGHKSIAGIFKVDDTQGNARHKGYVKALQEAGLLYDPDKVTWYHTEDKDIKPAAVATSLVHSHLGIDAIVCYNDQVALEVIKALERQGVRVPEDISITGYDNSFIAENGPVKLTTISHPKELLGQMAAELLLEKLHDIPDEESKVLRLIEPELIIRESCKDRR